MRWFSFVLALAALAGACSSSDGARAECAEGGALSACPEAERTAQGACTRLVDCGAIPLQSDNNFDWGKCVDNIEQHTADRQRIIIDCIAVSTCDSLKLDRNTCFLLGDQP